MKIGIILQVAIIILVLSIISLVFTYIKSLQEAEKVAYAKAEKTTNNRLLQHEDKEYICNVIFV